MKSIGMCAVRRACTAVSLLAGIVAADAVGASEGTDLQWVVVRDGESVATRGDGRSRPSDLQFAAIRTTPNDPAPVFAGTVEQSLIDAAARGDTAAVKRLLGEPIRPNVATEDGVRALAAAVGQGHAEIVRLLLDAGADPDAKGDSGFTPLGLAAVRGYARIVTLLVRAGARLDKRSSNGNAPIHDAIALDRRDCANVLLAARPDLSLPNRDGLTALDVAIIHGRKQVARVLLEMGALSRSLDPAGLAALTRSLATDAPAAEQAGDAR